MGARLVIVDDHPVVRLGLVQLFQLEPGIEVVGEAGSVEEALPLIVEGVDLVVTDLRMDGLDGLALTRLVKASHPDVGVLMLSSYDESLFAEQALDAGASGYLMKDTPPERLHRAVRSALAGQVTLSGRMWDRLRPRQALGEDLSLDERALVDGLAGAPTTDIGLMRRLGKPLREVERLRNGLVRRLGLRTPVELMLLAHWEAHQHPVS